ncbi:MAG TPA: RNA 2',3'-cyclic phosphodiesterase [Marinobacterium sp.]|nr:RNA 2',3'-cyclic phosphodiesterase [Marinobacterium sp.]
MNVRAFFALRVPERVTRKLADYADELCQFDRGLEAHWVDSSSYHLTLCFLGDVSLEQVEELEERTREAINANRFSVALDQIGYYAVNPRLSVVAAMTSEQQEVAELHDCLVDVATAAGLKYDEKNFLPHITLARLPSENQFELDTDQLPKLDLSLPADAIVLMQSRPGEQGSIYTPLFEIDLPLPRAN